MTLNITRFPFIIKSVSPDSNKDFNVTVTISQDVITEFTEQTRIHIVLLGQ